MVAEITKTDIAIGLLVGVIALTFFTFIGNIANKLIFKEIDDLSQESYHFFRLSFLLTFIGLLILTSIFLIKIIITPTDLHYIFDFFRTKFFLSILIIPIILMILSIKFIIQFLRSR